MRPSLRAVLCALLLLAGPTLVAAESTFDPKTFPSTPYVLKNGISGRILAFTSHNPADYGPLLNGQTGPTVELTGQLFLPKDAHGPVPVVILAPGSGNLAPNYFAHAAELTDAGIGAFAIDPFTGRGVLNTIADQDQFSFAASAYDVLAATQALRNLPDVDGQRIGATGGSRGGTAVLMAAMRPMSDTVLGPGRGLRAIVGGYPWCGVQFWSARLAQGTSLLVMQGDHDDWVNPLQCQDAVHAMSVAGQDAVMELIPGARHSFDRAGVPPTTFANAVKALRLPTIYMDDSGRYFNPRTGKVDPTTTQAGLLQYAAKSGLLDKGASIGSEGTQAADYAREMTEFFKAHLLAR